MTNLLVTWLLSAVSLLLVAYVVKGFDISGFGFGFNRGDRDRPGKRNYWLLPEGRHVSLDDTHLRVVLVGHQRAHVKTRGRSCAWFQDKRLSSGLSWCARAESRESLTADVSARLTRAVPDQDFQSLAEQRDIVPG